MVQSAGDCSVEGDLIVYTFYVYNTGDSPISEITITDPLFEAPNPVVAIEYITGDVNTNGILEGDEIWEYTATYVVTQEDIDNGGVINQATVEGISQKGEFVTDISDDTSILEDDPTITDLCVSGSLSVTKAGVFNDENGDLSAQVGETISYTFTVTNTGNITLYNIVITDPIPDVIVEGGPIEVLAPGEVDSTTYTATYVITQADIDAGEFVNQALVTAEDTNGNTVEDTSDDPNDPTDVDINGDGEPDDPTVVILPSVLGEVDFEIFNGITPDGDGLNDFFLIQGIENYPNNNLKIYNRWGVLVFETEGYGINGNVFRGYSQGRSTVNKNEKLPTGTYYFILVRIDPETGETLTNNDYLYINN